MSLGTIADYTAIKTDILSLSFDPTETVDHIMVYPQYLEKTLADLILSPVHSIILTDESRADLMGLIASKIDVEKIVSDVTRGMGEDENLYSSEKGRKIFYKNVGEIGYLIYIFAFGYKDDINDDLMRGGFIREILYGPITSDLGDSCISKKGLPNQGAVERLVVKTIENKVKMISMNCVKLIPFIPLLPLSDQRKFSPLVNNKMGDFSLLNKNFLLEFLLSFNGKKGTFIEESILILSMIDKIKKLFIYQGKGVESFNKLHKELCSMYDDDDDDINGSFYSLCSINNNFSFEEFIMYYYLIISRDEQQLVCDEMVEGLILENYGCRIEYGQLDRLLKNDLWGKITALPFNKRKTVGRFLIENNKTCINQEYKVFVEYLIADCDDENFVKINNFFLEGKFNKKMDGEEILIKTGIQERKPVAIVQAQTKRVTIEVAAQVDQLVEEPRMNVYAQLLSDDEFWSKFISDSESDNKNIWSLYGCLEDDDKLYIMENFDDISEIDVVELERFINFLKEKFYSSVQISLEDLNYVNNYRRITNKRMSSLYTIFKEYRNDKNVSKLREHIISYLLGDDDTGLTNFMKPGFLIQDEFAHENDKSLVRLFNEGSEEDISGLATLLEKQVHIISNKLSPALFSSTTHPQNGLGNGSYARIMKSIFNRLKRQNGESEEEYVLRVIICDIGEFYEDVDGKESRLISILSHIPNNNGFCNFLDVFSENVIGGIGLNEVEDIAALKKGFQNIAENSIEEIENSISALEIEV